VIEHQEIFSRIYWTLCYGTGFSNSQKTSTLWRTIAM